MNRAQQYISDYLNSGIQHFRTSKTPMNMTGDPEKDIAFRKELHEHCTRSPHWRLVHNNRSTARFHNPIGGQYGIIIDFTEGSGGIAHEF